MTQTWEDFPEEAKNVNLTGIDLIALERDEQIIKHCRSVKDDVIYNKQKQLAEAAMILADPDICYIDGKFEDYPEEIYKMTALESCPNGWNADIWKKMVSKPRKERLIIAGALIAAEIDRLNFNS